MGELLFIVAGTVGMFIFGSAAYHEFIAGSIWHAIFYAIAAVVCIFAINEGLESLDEGGPQML